jgi:hypothetical protein
VDAYERTENRLIYPSAAPTDVSSGKYGMVGYAAESGSELFYGNAAAKNTMPETVTVDGPPVAKGAATVSASALALHLDCTRTYIGKLEAEGVIRRHGDGFPLVHEPRSAAL